VDLGFIANDMCLLGILFATYLLALISVRSLLLAAVMTVNPNVFLSSCSYVAFSLILSTFWSNHSLQIA
jgi:hypothetical protein